MPPAGSSALDDAFAATLTAATPDELEKQWLEIRGGCNVRASRAMLSAWITDLRIARKNFVVDELLSDLRDPALVADIIAASGGTIDAPLSLALFARATGRYWLDVRNRVRQELTARWATEFGPIVTAAFAAARPQPKTRVVAAGMLFRRGLVRLGVDVVDDVSQRAVTEPVTRVLREIVESIITPPAASTPSEAYASTTTRSTPAAAPAVATRSRSFDRRHVEQRNDVGDEAPEVASVRPKEPPGPSLFDVEPRVPNATKTAGSIARPEPAKEIPAPIAAPADAAVVERLRGTIERFLPLESQIVFAVMLWQSDVRPSVEGRTIFSRELRGSYERLAREIDAEIATVGGFKRGFLGLSVGARAPITIDPPVSAPNALRIGEHAAQLVPDLQRVLRALPARTQTIETLVRCLSTRSRMDDSTFAQRMTGATGTNPPAGLAWFIGESP